MPTANSWEEFFDGHAPVYMDNSFTRHTESEIDFVLDVMKPSPGSRILDVGCGTGRHSIELARRGYRVTGVDISAGMLARAEAAAEQAGVAAVWVKCDATRFHSAEPFDAAICLCEGAFALLGRNDDPHEHDLAILRNVYGALRPGAHFTLTTLSAYRMARIFTNDDVTQGRFDPATTTETYSMEIDTPSGKASVSVRERGYTPGELRLLFGEAGLKVTDIWGGTAGRFARRKIDLDEHEIMVVARRPASIGTPE